MTAAEIACVLGVAQRSGVWWRCRCPVHNSRGATLALRDGDRGPIVHCHAGCDPRDILAELRSRGLLYNVGGYHAFRGRDGDDDPQSRMRRAEFARRIWTAAREAPGSPVARYLASRGITLPLPASLRWAPSLRRQDGRRGPAMVARIDDLSGRLIGVHRTWVECDPVGGWRRGDRASLGPIRGGAVRLSPPAETLMIGEGVETCLAAMQATGMPAWVALSTSGMTALLLPAEVRHVIILADNDLSGAGERAARTAAARWLGEGRRVRIAIPPEPGTDMADVLVGRGCARVTEARDVAA